MPELHLKQLGFTYSACGPFLRYKKRIQKIKETRDTKYIYKNELDKACFQHDIVYGYFKDSTKRTTSDNFLREFFNFLKLQAIQNMMDIKEVLFLWFINFLIKSQQIVVLKMKFWKISS